MSGVTKVNLFVTGGWDSTFMLCKLSRENVSITPIYVLNKKRKSRDMELKSITKILNLLSKHSSTKASFTKLQIIDLDTVQINPKIVAARRRLMAQVGLLGYQYDYLASIAKKLGMVGLGVEKAPAAMEVGAAATLHHFAHLKKAKYGYTVDQARSNPDVNLIFGHIFFPIIDITEREMLEWTKKNGYNEIMQSIWFCHSPIGRRPCGLCRPCEEKMSSKMGFLLPSEAKNRYNKAQKWGFLGEKGSRYLKKMKIFALRFIK